MADHEKLAREKEDKKPQEWQDRSNTSTNDHNFPNI